MDKDLRFYIKHGSDERELKHSPDGWDDFVIEIDRADRYIGVVRTFSVNLKFVLDGAAMLRTLFYNKDISNTLFVITRLNRVLGVYESAYTGVFDFSSFVDTADTVTISVTDTNLSNYLKNNKDKDFDIRVPLTHSCLIHRRTKIIELGGTTYGFEAYSRKCIFFSDLVKEAFDFVTEGRYKSGEFGLDYTTLLDLENSGHPVSALINESVITNEGATDMNVSSSFAKVLEALFALYELVGNIHVINGKQVFRLVHIRDTFPAQAHTELRHVSNIKISVAKEFCADVVKVGHRYDNQGTVTVVSKRYDMTFHTYRNFEEEEPDFGYPSLANSYGVTVADGANTLEIINPFGCSSAKIQRAVNETDIEENLRLNLQDVFVIRLRKNAVSVWETEFGDISFGISVGGVLAKRRFIYNLSISSGRMANTHARYISSFVRPNASIGYNWNESAGWGNAKTTTYADTACTQVDTEWDEGREVYSGGRYFIPIYIELDCILPAGFLRNVYEVQNLRCKFNVRGLDIEGFIISGKINVFGKEKASLKILLAPGFDLTQLAKA